MKASAAAKPGKAGDVSSVEEGGSSTESAPTVSLTGVLRTSDPLDLLLIATGSTCAAACGAVQPWCVRTVAATRCTFG